MIQEDQNQLCSNNTSNRGVDNGGANDGGGGGDGDDGGINTKSSSLKKLKQKKVPQRGLGVAQLEKIRMEEQQKKDVNNNFSSSTISPTNSNSSSSPINFPLPNYPHINNKNHKSSNANIPCTPPPPLSLPPNPNFKTHLTITENLNSSSIPSLNASNGDGFQVGWPLIPVHGNVSFPKLWHPRPQEFHPDHNGENAIFPLSLSLPYETINSVPLPDVVPRSNAQPHQPSCSNSLVNGSSNNLSSSSVLNFPIEPPSNQNLLSNYSPFSSDEENMMIGMKRSCPFSFDNPSIPIFQGKFTPETPHSVKRSHESTSSGIGGTTNNLDFTIPIFRDVPSWPSTMSEPTNSSRKMSRKENGNSQNGEFLSLAPPTLTSSFPNSRFKQLCKFETLPYQASIEDPITGSRNGGSSQQQNLFSFLHPTKRQATTSTTPPTKHNKCNGEIGETIDLNLKL